ncbi:membrane protein insertase YidC [Streptomyces sp. NBC_01775]|uniref:membrane protein insertase YidC n=1 Tax=Streptomyces sp. NBC_01775 TaxID=2975939 RepID=UPI002DD889F2|nr:membrane protein insertase YidC [Streptomyces sp. NBC_01775]WSB78006.1 membrane protein insertase YidC [Streptomyces sp. NBC_01775]
MDTILSPLYTAVSWIIVQFHSLFSLVFDENSGWAWGLSIFCLVVLIRICLIPLFVKQIKSTRNMQALQPKMKAIQERYKSDKQRQSEEMMKLYKETGTNPLSSCLPILAQSPFFIALFQVLNHIAGDRAVGVLTQSQVDSARNAKIFGAPIAAKFMDSAGKAQELAASLTDIRVVTVIMIVLMSASQFYTQRQLMTKNVDLTVKTPFMQQQKMLMYVFPIMFAVFGINFPVGVLVYWLTTNVWTMGQQLFVIKRNPTPGSRAFNERQEKLRAAGKLKEDPKEVEAREAVEAARARRQQPKRQSKSRRQTGPVTGGTAGTEKTGATTSLEKADAPGVEDAAPTGQKKAGAGQKQGQKTPQSQQKSGQKPGQKQQSGQAKSGQQKSGQKKSGQKKSGQQRKGPQRPKHPSKK